MKRLLITLILIALLVGTVSGLYATFSPTGENALYNGSVNNTFAEKIAAVKGSDGKSVTSSIYLFSANNDTPGLYTQLYRNGLVFDTSSLPDGAQLTQVNLSIRGSTRSNSLGALVLNVTRFTPASYTLPNATTDFVNFNNTGIGSITYAGYATTYYNNITLLDMTAVNTSGYTGLGIRFAVDADNNEAGITWAKNTFSRYQWVSMWNLTGPMPLLYVYYNDPTPDADFTSNVTIGKSPVTIQFNDTSTNTPTSWNWSFGDNTYSIVQNATHTYTLNGTFNVTLTATNSGGTNSEVKNNYTYIRGFNHPITVNKSAIPGVVNMATAPWSTSFTSAVSSCGGGLNQTANYAVTSVTFEGDDLTERCYANYLATAYSTSGNTTYVNSTVDALLHQYSSFYYSGEQTRYDYAQAYDLIEETVGWSNTTLDYKNNSQIRTNLMENANDQSLNQNVASFGMNPHAQAMTYATLGMYGHILSDFRNVTNTSIITTPATLQSWGEEGLWSNDPSTIATHNYNWRIAGDQGIMADWINPNSGAVLEGRYRLYVDDYLDRYMVAWSNIHGRSIITDYPVANKYAMSYSWQVMSLGKTIQAQTQYWQQFLKERTVYSLLSATDRADLHYVIQYMTNSTWGWSASSFTPSPISYILYAENYETAGIRQPAWTSTLTKNGDYQVFRKNWDYLGDTLVFLTINETSYTQRIGRHQDQLSFDYSSHGDAVMPDAGEIQIAPYAWTADGRYGAYGPFHNGLMVGNGTVNFSRSEYYSGNLTYRGITKNTQLGYFNATVGAYNQNLIQTPNLEAIDGTFDNATVYNFGDPVRTDEDNPIKLNPMVNVSRTVIYPLKDYFIVVDRFKSGQTREFVNNFRFGSMTYTKNATPYISNDLNQSAHVNGSLSLDGIMYDWSNEAKLAAVPLSTGQTINKIVWNTTNLAGDMSNLTLFTSPATPATYLKFMTHISAGSSSSQFGKTEEDYSTALMYALNPQVLLVPTPATSLYRITSIISEYSNATTKTPTELTVTGTGSAINVAGTGGVADTIYTGLGTSTFGGITTDADTAFVREKNNVTDFVLINGSTLSDGNGTWYTGTRQSYVVLNRTVGGSNVVNMSGTGFTLGFHTPNGAATNVKVDGSAATYTATADTLSITTVPSGDHSITFDENGGSGTTAQTAFTPIVVGYHCPQGVFCMPFIYLDLIRSLVMVV